MQAARIEAISAHRAEVSRQVELERKAEVAKHVVQMRTVPTASAEPKGSATPKAAQEPRQDSGLENLVSLGGPTTISFNLPFYHILAPLKSTYLA